MVAASERLVMLPDREQHLALTYAEFAAREVESAHAEWSVYADLARCARSLPFARATRLLARSDVALATTAT
jgi:hypothetical protein